MQPFEIGTIVRFKQGSRYQSYGKRIFNRVDGLVIAGPYQLGSSYCVLKAIDGSDPLVLEHGYVNGTRWDYLELDIFMHACREAIKETE